MVKNFVYVIGFYGVYIMLRKLLNKTSTQIDYMARTIYGEARGEGTKGMQAVANVIMNRVSKGGWYGATIKDVVLKPYQFSCWNDNDVNKTVIINASDKQLSTAKNIAQNVVNGNLPDITGGATNYHANNICPQWSLSMTKTVSIGKHIFYKE